MEYQWPQKAEIQGWPRWRRHVLVVAVAIILNMLIFLTIPFLSQLREAEPEERPFAGTPTMVSMQPADAPETDSQDEEKTTEPEEPQDPPRPEFEPQNVEFSPPSPPDLPELELDVPEMDLGQISVSQPREPEPVESAPQPSPAPDKQKPKPSEPAAKQAGFSLDQVDSHPRLTGKVNPTYPFQAKRRGIEGKVILRFLVDKKGQVSQVSVKHAQPEGTFEQSAIKAVRQWQFEPAKKDGRFVATWVEVPIRFELSR
jgi:protein TonB